MIMARMIEFASKHSPTQQAFFLVVVFEISNSCKGQLDAFKCYTKFREVARSA